MLVIIDAQNSGLHPAGSTYIGNQELADRLVEKTKSAVEQGQSIIYTKDIPIEYKNDEEEQWELQIIDELKKLLGTAIEVKKHYYGIPPKKMQELQEKFAATDFTKEKIELIGVETEICVLANLIIFLSAFPEADFVISQGAVASRDKEKERQALELFRHWGVSIMD